MLEYNDFNELVLAVIQTESGGDPNAVSPVGARGLMQLMPNTAKQPGFGIKGIQDDSPEENVRVGSEYLKAMLSRYDNNLDLALMAYNWGPGNADKLRNKIPKETIDYVHRVRQQLAKGRTDALPHKS